jgi:hypothetical protein
MEQKIRIHEANLVGELILRNQSALAFFNSQEMLGCEVITGE